MTTNNRLPKLPSLPKSKTTVACDCGCGESTQSRFAPGHDSKLKARRLRIERGVMTWNELTELLGEDIARATAREMGLSYADAMNKEDDAAEQARATEEGMPEVEKAS